MSKTKFKIGELVRTADSFGGYYERDLGVVLHNTVMEGGPHPDVYSVFWVLQGQAIDTEHFEMERA